MDWKKAKGMKRGKGRRKMKRNKTKMSEKRGQKKMERKKVYKKNRLRAKRSVYGRRSEFREEVTGEEDREGREVRRKKP